MRLSRVDSLALPTVTAAVQTGPNPDVRLVVLRTPAAKYREDVSGHSWLVESGRVRVQKQLQRLPRFNRELPRRFFRKVQNDLSSILFVIQLQNGLFFLRHNGKVEVPGNC